MRRLGSFFESPLVLGCAPIFGATRGVAQKSKQSPTPSRKHTNKNPAGGGGAAPQGSTGFSGEKEQQSGVRFEFVGKDSKTRLDRLYEDQQARTRKILTTKFDQLSADGSYKPDFLVGLREYNYQIRDQYRHLLAQKLGLPLNCIKLSVGWSEKLDLRFMRNVKTVVGVTILAPTGDPLKRPKKVLEENEYTHFARHAKNPEKMVLNVGDDEGAESVTKSEVIAALIRHINARTDPELVSVHIVRGAKAMKEVEATTAEYTEEFSSAKMVFDEVVKQFAAVFIVEDSLKAKTGIRGWETAMYRAGVVPLIVSVPSAGGGADDKKEIVLLPKNEELGRKDDVTINAKTLKDIIMSVSGIATSHVDEQMEAEDVSLLNRHKAGDDSAAAATAASGGVFHQHLPAVFIHGSYIGSVNQMKYLLNNKAAFDLVVSTPNNIETKETIHNR